MAISEEQRKAASDRMKARWAAKKAKQTPQNKPQTDDLSVSLSDDNKADESNITANEPIVTIGKADLDDLVRQVNELKQQFQNNQYQSGTASAAGGKLTGTFEKYPTAKELYPDPSERLSDEQKLQRFAFKINYELNFEVSESAYTTIDGIRTKEPKFTLELIRIMIDEDTGDPGSGRYVICKLIMHEDPDTAIAIAKQYGIQINDDNEAGFLNEMRYLRMRDWLIECFYPPKPAPEKQRKDMVIEGKLVSYWEVNTEKGKAKIDFDKLPKVQF